MGKKSRDKGKRGEREAAKELSKLLGIDIVRGVQYQGSADSADLGGLREYGLHPEIKRDETTVSVALYKALFQASSDSGGQSTPFVMSRRNKRQWVVSVNADDLIDFCAKIMEIVHEKNI